MKTKGFSLIEILITSALAMLIFFALLEFLTTTRDVHEITRSEQSLVKKVDAVMHRIKQMADSSPVLMLPLKDNPTTTQNEAKHSVLAFALGKNIDRDNDGFPDADNDRDGLIDEDIGEDMNNDGKAGIIGIDDNNDGTIDNSSKNDDDEDGLENEDAYNLIDSDTDNNLDEDIGNDYNSDDAPGIAGIDDDNDGEIDEGDNEDDDEDGKKDEDWLDSVVYYLSNKILYERLPEPHADQGHKYTENIVMEDVDIFQITRVVTNSSKQTLVNIFIEVSDQSGHKYSRSENINFGAL